MGLVVDLFVQIVVEFVLFGTGAVLLRALTCGRVRAVRWTPASPVGALGSRRAEDGALEIGSTYAVLVGLAVWLGALLWLLWR